MNGGLVLIAGATGYVGRRLLAAFEARGQAVRCLARDPRRLTGVSASTQVVQGDALDPASLGAAMAGVDTVYFLIHAMDAAGDFAAQERRAAENVARAAKAAGVRRLVYLGGLGEDGPALSPHLRSRQDVGELLRREGPPTIEFRAGIIIGSGSLSFEIIRALVERLPVMITPRWVDTPTQPIGIADVIAYLIAARDVDLRASAVYEIGGPQVTSYGELMREYARQRGLRRWMIRVPVLTPRLSSLWLSFVTPVFARVGRKLVEGLRNPTIVRDPAARRVFLVEPAGLPEAVALALADSSSAPLLRETVTRTVAVPPETAFAAIERIGGAHGWYYANALWKLRGAMDLAVGGVGLRRGRKDPNRLTAGEALDFWQVETLERGRRLRLRAEMKLPGNAWLEFTVDPDKAGATLTQTATFEPHGLAGLLYWYALYPVHRVMFKGMLREIARAAEAPSTTAPLSV